MGVMKMANQAYDVNLDNLYQNEEQEKSSVEHEAQQHTNNESFHASEDPNQVAARGHQGKTHSESLAVDEIEQADFTEEAQESSMDHDNANPEVKNLDNAVDIAELQSEIEEHEAESIAGRGADRKVEKIARNSEQKRYIYTDIVYVYLYVYKFCVYVYVHT